MNRQVLVLRPSSVHLLASALRDDLASRSCGFVTRSHLAGEVLRASLPKRVPTCSYAKGPWL